MFTSDSPQALFELDTREAARVLGVHPKTLIDWVNAGKVQAMKTPGKHYRFRRSDLEDFAVASLIVPKAAS